MPHARTLDPSTSHQAAASVSNIGELKRAILDTLQTAMTDRDLVTQIMWRYGDAFASESGIRSRRAELTADGFIEDTGARVKMPSGRNAIVWVKA
jgi:hypothetical protein